MVDCGVDLKLTFSLDPFRRSLAALRNSGTSSVRGRTQLESGSHRSSHGRAADVQLDLLKIRRDLAAGQVHRRQHVVCVRKKQEQINRF